MGWQLQIICIGTSHKLAGEEPWDSVASTRYRRWWIPELGIGKTSAGV